MDRIHKQLTIICVVLLVLVSSARAANSTELFELRDEGEPLFEIKPWSGGDKAVFRELFGLIQDLAPGLVQRTTAYRPIRVYRVDNLPQIKIISLGSAMAYKASHSIFLTDDFFSSPEPKRFHFLTHELTHLADSANRMAHSKEWVEIMTARIDRVHNGIAEQGHSLIKALNTVEGTAIAGKEGLPTGYTAYNLDEALAECVSFVIISKVSGLREGFSLAEGVESFMERNVFSTPFKPDPSIQHFHRGMDLEHEGLIDEAIWEYSKAIQVDPNFGYAYEVRARHLIGRDPDRAMADLDRAIELSYEKRSVDKRLTLDRARIWEKKGNYDEALNTLDRYLESDPPYVEIGYVARGRIWVQKNELGKAKEDFDRAIEIDPTYWDAFLNRGILWDRKKDYTRAIADFSEVIKLKPEVSEIYIDAFYRRGKAWYVLGEYEKAIADATHVIEFATHVYKLNPSYIGAYTLRASALYDKRLYDKAAADCDEVFKISPSFEAATVPCSMAYHGAGSRRLALRDFDKAIQYLDKAIQLNPDKAEILVDRGYAYGGKNEYDRAIHDYTEAIRLKPDYASAYSYRGGIYARKGEYDPAIRDFTQAISLKPDYLTAYQHRSRVFYLKRQYDLAIQDYNQIIRLRPHDDDTLYSRASAYFYLGLYDEAISDYDQVIQRKPNNAVGFYARGLSWEKKKDFDKAIADFNECIKRAANFSQAYGSRAHLWLTAKKDFDKAIADCNVIIKLQPNNATAYYMRGRAWQRKEDFRKAISDFDQAISISPKFTSPHNALAFVLAACPDVTLRDGAKAVKAATRACELSDWKNPFHISVLAAAYAEVGEFQKAVKRQTEALEMAPAQSKAEFQYELELYQAGKTYRKKE